MADLDKENQPSRSSDIDVHMSDSSPRSASPSGYVTAPQIQHGDTGHPLPPTPRTPETMGSSLADLQTTPRARVPLPQTSPTLPPTKKRRGDQSTPSSSSSKTFQRGSSTTSSTGDMDEDPLQYLISGMENLIDRMNSSLLKQQQTLDSVQKHLDWNTTALTYNSQVLDRLTTVIDSNFSSQTKGHHPTQRDQRDHAASGSSAWKKEKGKGRAKDQDQMEVDEVQEALSTAGRSSEGEGDADGSDDDSFPIVGRKQKKYKSRAIKHEARASLDKKAMIRQWLKEILGDIDLLESKVTVEEATEFARVFAKHPLECPCTQEDFRYFLAGGPRSAWNIGASYVFLDILETKRLFVTDDPELREEICEGFLLRMKSLRQDFLRNSKPTDIQEMKKAYKRKWQRKYTLFHQRREVVTTLPGFETFVPYLDQLGIDGMSSDESDMSMARPRLQFLRLFPRWSSEELREYIRKLDLLHLESRLRRDGLIGDHFGQGAPPRLRVPHSEISKSSNYIKGLPRNFYDAGWLEEQEPGWIRGGRGLVNVVICPQPKFKLVFPVDLEKWVTCSIFAP
ncbi:hypothetical protein GYMLUDRAFT_60480 [Collybiopsis luxurians FD-317 M1]|uniref:Uncharacterized protein n=1 Tax=Collybiopsis luxurians FD-317 M1 TaxID=944289 RepID=A0A0D0CJT9_9AGAR|nr:hypothetical protein GYMLUDRAFT_60480 [Collybiopsis luxurians FD-317 M1]